MSEESKALLDAAKSGFIELIQELDNEPDCDINHAGGGRLFGKTALHLAIIHGSVEIVKFLLTAPDIQVNKAAKRGDTAAHYAANHADIEVLKAVLMHPDLNITLKNNKGETPLDLATNNYHDHHVEMINNYIKDPTPFQAEYKARQRNTAVVKNMPPESPKGKTVESGVPTLNEKFESKVEEAMGKPMDNERSGSVMSDFGFLREGRVESVLEDGGLTLLEAAGKGNMGRIINLVGKGEDINQAGKGRKFGRTALHFAVLGKHTHVVKYLVEQDNIDINKANNVGNTALHFCVKVSDAEILKILLSHPDIDVSIRNKSGRTPLEEAVKQQASFECQELLKKAV